MLSYGVGELEPPVQKYPAKHKPDGAVSASPSQYIPAVQALQSSKVSRPTLLPKVPLGQGGCVLSVPLGQ